MVAYLKQVIKFFHTFEKFELVQIPQSENSHVDAHSKLASGKDSELLIVIPIEQLPSPSISKEREVMWVKNTPT